MSRGRDGGEGESGSCPPSFVGLLVCRSRKATLKRIERNFLTGCGAGRTRWAAGSGRKEVQRQDTPSCGRSHPHAPLHTAVRAPGPKPAPARSGGWTGESRSSSLYLGPQGRLRALNIRGVREVVWEVDEEPARGSRGSSVTLRLGARLPLWGVLKAAGTAAKVTKYKRWHKSLQSSRFFRRGDQPHFLIPLTPSSC